MSDSSFIFGGIFFLNNKWRLSVHPKRCKKMHEKLDFPEYPAFRPLPLSALLFNIPLKFWHRFGCESVSFHWVFMFFLNYEHISEDWKASMMQPTPPVSPLKQDPLSLVVPSNKICPHRFNSGGHFRILHLCYLIKQWWDWTIQRLNHHTHANMWNCLFSCILVGSSCWPTSL